MDCEDVTKHLYRQRLLRKKPLHTKSFTQKHRGFYTQSLCTQTLLHTDTFYTQTALHTVTFTHERFSHTDPFTHRRFYTRKLLHTDAFTQTVYTQTLLHKQTLYTQLRQTKSHYSMIAGHSADTQTLFHTNPFTYRQTLTDTRFYTQTL